MSVTFGVMPLNANNVRTLAFIPECVPLLINIMHGGVSSKLNLRKVAMWSSLCSLGQAEAMSLEKDMYNYSV